LSEHAVSRVPIDINSICLAIFLMDNMFLA